MKRLFFILFIFLFSFSLKAQIEISGKVIDEKKQPLPFVTVYVKETNISVASNERGEFSLIVPSNFMGNKVLIFQYIGYKIHTENFESSIKNLIITLKSEEYLLNEVVITTKKRENPADRIIKLAQAKRQFYLEEELKAWQCKVYQKNLTIAHKIPKIIKKKAEIDTGIVGLSESVSELLYENKKYREKILATKSSGEPNQIQIVSIAGLWNNLYDKISGYEYSERGFVSPISPSAMLYYRFQLLGESIENGKKIHKIKLLPRKTYSPAYNGVIYIEDQTWRIVQSDLYITKKGLDFGDSVVVQQMYKPFFDNKGNVYQLPHTQRMWIKINFLGASFTDQLNGFYKEYEINPIFPLDLFSEENKSIKVDTLAAKRDTLFWKQYRPFALSERELRDYQIKDSIANIKNDTKRLDSLRLRRNRYTLSKLFIGGYKYEPKNPEHTSFSMPSLLNGIGFNTVEGFLLQSEIRIRKIVGYRQILDITPTLRYGFANQRLQGKINLKYSYLGKRETNITLTGGQFIEQISRMNSIDILLNTAYTLLDEQNFMKLYEKRYIKTTWEQKLNKTFSFETSLEFASRNVMKNNTDYTWRNVQGREYSSNIPTIAQENTANFLPHNALISETTLFITPKNIPFFNKIYLNYRKGIGANNTQSDFDFIHIGLNGDRNWGMFGETSWNIEAGKFITKNSITFIDYKHFLGNQTILINDNLQSFQLLDYYYFSQNTEYLKAHFSHRFKGFLTNDLFFMRFIRSGLRVSGNYLYSPLTSNYFELGAGIDIQGAGVEYFHSWMDKNNTQNRGIKIRIPF
ncbi:MAG: hypothetical protein EAZ85_05885 [Bacteroidetes bacterium]|nr:MAG: hypothetical protein EAZ85_05885 [Bacteroidota bacterium]TAG90119.1 MAG: hypothetical protein EAZ20_05000 [Bacteroidota bacterium]